MKFFVDTADVAEIADLAATGLLDGVTTNPSLIAKSALVFFDVVAEICSLVEGPVSAEVAATEVETMIAEGLIDAPYWIQLCLSIPYGTPLDIGILQAMVNRLPDEAEFTSFGLGAMQMPMVTQSVMLGGHVRVVLVDILDL